MNQQKKQQLFNNLQQDASMLKNANEYQQMMDDAEDSVVMTDTDNDDANGDMEMGDYPSSDIEEEDYEVEDYGDDDDDEDDAEYGFDSQFSGGDYDPLEDEGISDMINRPKVYQVEYSTLTVNELESQMKRDISQVSELCGTSSSIGALMLQIYNWNKEKLLERWVEDSEQVIAQCGLKNMNLSAKNQLCITSSSRSAASSPIGSSKKQRISNKCADLDQGFMCEICCRSMAELDGMSIISLSSCGHKFCEEDYRFYVEGKIRDNELNTITCPADCKLRIDPDSIQHIVDKDSYHQYQKLLLKNYVDSSMHLKWCPQPDCEGIVKCNHHFTADQMPPAVECPLHHEFCFNCSGENHQPLVCSFMKKWMKKCQDDSETSNWLSANTKECPKCHATIEKNGGCNHMTCKTCKYEYCWVCMGPWAEHGQNFYNCNRFDEKASVEARDKQSQSRAQLERYLHYFNRFANHAQSSKLATEFYRKTERKMEEMQLKSDFSWIDVQFMKKALDVLIQCRQTLKWTYAFAFYLTRNNAAHLFEDNQRDLEVAVETLNELIEKPLPLPGTVQSSSTQSTSTQSNGNNNKTNTIQASGDESTISDRLAELRKQIVDKTEYCSRRREVVLEDSAKGLSEKRWTYIM
ncbi:hypothetical protein MP228_001242 [Amoeboaphelidium protococcarum]|nr:hypothetical protein MP228_001242 [Amoeboaphelidium protococcarum]